MSDEKRYYVYIMASRSRTLYTGVTGDLFHRALQHKRGEIEGFTKKYNINRLVYCETFKYIDRAIAREKQIKAWTRAKRLALIQSVNPTWQDLAAGWGEPIKLQLPRSPSAAPRTARDDNSHGNADQCESGDSSIRVVESSGYTTELQIPRCAGDDNSYRDVGEHERVDSSQPPIEDRGEATKLQIPRSQNKNPEGDRQLGRVARDDNSYRDVGEHERVDSSQSPIEDRGEPTKLQIPRSQNKSPEGDRPPERVARDDNSYRGAGEQKNTSASKGIDWLPKEKSRTSE